MDDITKTGPVGLRGLSGLNRNKNYLDNFSVTKGKKTNSIVNEWSSPKTEYVGLELGSLGYGESKYDKDIINMEQARNIDEFRAQTQPWYDQLANGALKMLTTAGTTFLDGTLGTLMGLGTGLFNLMTDNPNAGFWRGMWDNAISNAMADINDAMEESFKNYRTEWEQNASVFERMFSGIGAANFWGDDILKNAGFTLGAAASIYATAGVGNALKGVGTFNKLGKGLNLLRNGAEGLEATKKGKIASWIANTFVSTQGEAAIEAVNGMRENIKDMEFNLDNRKKQLYQEAEANYYDDISNGVDPVIAEAALKVQQRAIDEDIAKYKNQMQAELQDAGNITYAANIAALSVSNNLTLGSLIRGGYGTSKSLLESAIRTVDGKEITKESTKEIAKGLLRGTLKFDAPALKGVAPKAAGRWLLQSSQEGIEEGVQNLANTTTQMSAQARMNKYARTDTMLGNMINPSAEEGLIDYSKALTKAYQDQFGAANSQGWTEVMAGFISGALGIPGMHRNEQGKLRPKLQGGIFEAVEAITGENKAIKRQAELLNEALTNNKFGERVRNAVAQLSIKEEQNKALEENDIRRFKNGEIKQLVQDAITFRDLGMLDEYLGMYQELASNVTDEDVAELRAAVKEEGEDKLTALDKKTDDELKTLYSDKAQSTLNKVKEVLNDYDALDKQYGNKFSDQTRRYAINELTFKNTLLWDTYRRIDELEKQNEEIERKKDTTVAEKEIFENNKKAIDSLTKQVTALRDSLNEYKNDPKKLQKEIEDAISDYQKEQLYKQTETAINKYKEATTYQDVMDIFYHSPEGDREAVLNQAIEQSEGETQTLLTNFRDFLGDVNTLQEIIADRFKAKKDEKPEEIIEKLHSLQAFQSILMQAAQEMLNDESPILSREKLKDKLLAKLQEWQNEFDTNTLASEGVTINDDGSFNFSEAIDNGVISLDEDFDSILDNPDTGESHLEVKEGSKADNMSKAASIAKEAKYLMDHMNYFINSLDKLDELRETAKKKKESKKKKSEESEKLKEKKSKDKKKKESGEKKEAKGATFDDDEEGESFDEEEDNDDISEEEEKGEEKKKESSKGKTNSPLSKTEEKHYDKATLKDKDGREYHSFKKKSKKDAPQKVKESMHKKLERTLKALNSLIENLNEKKFSDEQKSEILEEFLEDAQEMLFVPRLIDNLNKILTKYSYLLKPDSSKESSKGEHTNKEGQSLSNSDISLNGNQSYEYVESELSGDKAKMVQITTQRNGKTPVQVWLRENHYNPQRFIDLYLNQIIERDSEKKDPKDRTPVYYLHTNELENVVFLGMKYADVEDIVPDSEFNLIPINGENYILIGTLGWESARPGTHEMYDSLLEETSEFHATDESKNGWVVNTKHTNRVKDISAGAKVKQTLLDNESQVRDLKELLETSERNPYELELEDLGWTIILGKEDNPKPKHINEKPGQVYNVVGRPGQVYVHIPASNGMSIPIYIEPMFFQELGEDTPLMEEIKSHISTLIDSEATEEDKKAAIIEIKDLLMFSNQNQVYYNDSGNRFDPNTIYITRNGQPIKIVDFNKEEGNEEDLLQAILSVNPRINISSKVLSSTPQLYLNSGVLTTDIAMLGTVNSKFYLYPTDENNEWVKNKPHKYTGEISDNKRIIRQRLYLNGQYVYYNNGIFEDAQHNTIDDEDGSLQMAYDIYTEKVKPIKYNNSTYFDDGTNMYTDNGHHGLVVIDSKLRDKVLKSGKAGKKAEERKKKVEEENKKNKKEEKRNEEKEKIPWSMEITHFAYNLQKILGDKKLSNGYVTILADDLNKIDPNLSLEQLNIEIEKAFKKINLGKYWNNLDAYKEKGISRSFVRGLILKKIKGESLEEDTLSPTEKDSTKKEEKSNFANGTDIDDVMSDEEMEKMKDADALSTVLNKSENETKTDSLYALVEEKLGVVANNNDELIKALIKNKIDITSNDIDTISDILKNCR